MLAVFIAGCLNMAIQSCLMAATLDDCHESSRLSVDSDLLQDLSAYIDADCAYCPEIDPLAGDPETSSAYSCVAMMTCSDDEPQLSINSAELKLKPGMACSSSLSQGSADASAYRIRIQPSVGVQTGTFSIRYCRFLI
jgi:hypothetical protein